MKKSESYVLQIPKKVEEKIRYLQKKFPSTEWSGVLFYTHTGSFEENNLEITCQDIYPMDLGNSTYTEFNMSDDVAAYMADNLELFECDLGLVHSHHSMSTFFSATDINTLEKEGKKRNCFVSLIVNNEGTYNAAITRKVQSECEVTIKNLGTSYEFFGNGKVKTEEAKSDATTEIVKKDVIEYFMLNVNVEHVDNPLAYLDKRFDEIQAIKKKDAKFNWIPTYSSEAYNKFPGSEVLNMYEPKGSKDSATQLTLWGNDFDEDTSHMGYYNTPIYSSSSSIYVDEKLVKEAVTRILTCSLLIDASKFDLDSWVMSHMEKKYNEFFVSPKSDAFSRWCDYIIESTIYSFDDAAFENAEDVDMYYSSVAQAILDALSKYKDFPYIKEYCKTLTLYLV